MNNELSQPQIDLKGFKRAERFCMTCRKTVKGRTDKKFCNETCRNNFYNQLNGETNNLVRNINQSLGKNRRIIESFFKAEDKVVTASSSELIQRGFLFKYFTHQYTNKAGNTYFFCYDYGYMLLGERCLLVRARG